MPIYKGSSQINVGATTHTHTLADITDAGSAAGSDTTDFAAASHTHTLSNITDAGTAAASDTGDFEPSGAVSSHSATTSGVHGISAYGATLVDDADAATARTTLGLGTAATSNTGDFAPTLHTHTLSQITDAGTAAASNTGDFEASGAVSTHAAVTSGVHGISAFGATLVDDADASAARTTLGLGTAATSNTGDFAAASHTHALGDLSDVDTAGATTGQVLEFDGADWVPATPSAGAAALNDLTDVSTAGATTGDVIVYNGSTWAPAAQSGGGEIVSDAENGVGENSVSNIIAITQAEYNALTPQADTFYIITDATAGTDYIRTPASGTVLRFFDDMLWSTAGWNTGTSAQAFYCISGAGSYISDAYAENTAADGVPGVIMWKTLGGNYQRVLMLGPEVYNFGDPDGTEWLFEARIMIETDPAAAQLAYYWGAVGSKSNLDIDKINMGGGVAAYGDYAKAGNVWSFGQTYLRKYYWDTEGTNGNAIESDITSVPLLTQSTWYRVGVHCYKATISSVPTWVVDHYLDGTLVSTQYLTSNARAPVFFLGMYQGVTSTVNKLFIDWVSFQYTRNDAVTMMDITDL